MVDSIGGPVRMNNFLSTLNIPEIQDKDLSLHGNCFGRNSDTLEVAIIKYNVLSFFRLIHLKSAEEKVDNAGQY